MTHALAKDRRIGILAPEPFDLARFLAGDWHLFRLGWLAVPSGTASQTMRLTGKATVTPHPDGLLFTETGLMRLGTYAGEAERRYVFRPDGPLAADVFFPDGRFFHRLDLAENRAAAHHDCPPDVYEGRYRILGADAWRLTWRVTGPRKNQRIASLFRRIPQSGPKTLRDRSPAP